MLSEMLESGEKVLAVLHLDVLEDGAPLALTEGTPRSPLGL
jgi:hypothetical protein